MEENWNSKRKNKRKYKTKHPSNIIYGDNVVSNDELDNNDQIDGNQETGFIGDGWPESIQDNAVIVVENIAIDALVFSEPTNLIKGTEIGEETENEDIKRFSDTETAVTNPMKTQEEIENEATKEFYNKKPLSRYATSYQLDKFEKHMLVIFNQENIEGFKPRLGTEKDVDALRNAFETFGFEVVEHKDLTREDIFEELNAFNETDFTDYGCVAMAVLTHGSKHGLLRAKDQQYSEVEILNYLKAEKNPTLLTKPRILLIQACRGTKSTAGMPVKQEAKTRKDMDEEIELYYLPVESDMLVIHSSYMGKPSHRDELFGSWFIQALCKKVNELAQHLDLESIVTEVKREVAIDRYHEEYNRRTFNIDVNKQMPVMTSTLIRKLYLTKIQSPLSIDNQEPAAIDKEPTIESKEVLDNECLTPLRVQFGPCSCFLDHFNYIKDCLRHFLEEHPDDLIAKSYLDIADTFEDGAEFNATKEKTLKTICAHLTNNYKDFQYYKYIHFYKS